MTQEGQILAYTQPLLPGGTRFSPQHLGQEIYYKQEGGFSPKQQPMKRTGHRSGTQQQI